MRKDPRLEQMLAYIIEERRDPDTPAAVLEYALAATRRAFTQTCQEHLTRTRVRSYFNAVVGRRLVKRYGGSMAAARLVAESVVADLAASGRDATTVIEELERGWRTTLPESVIRECRERLCA